MVARGARAGGVSLGPGMENVPEDDGPGVGPRPESPSMLPASTLRPGSGCVVCRGDGEPYGAQFVLGDAAGWPGCGGT